MTLTRIAHGGTYGKVKTCLHRRKTSLVPSSTHVSFSHWHVLHWEKAFQSAENATIRFLLCSCGVLVLLHVLDITVFKKWCFFTLSKPPWVQGFGVRPGFSIILILSQQLMIFCCCYFSFRELHLKWLYRKFIVFCIEGTLFSVTVNTIFKTQSYPSSLSSRVWRVFFNPTAVVLLRLESKASFRISTCNAIVG